MTISQSMTRQLTKPMKILSASKTVVTSETSISISNQKGTEPIYAELKGYEVLENTARYAKILLKHELTVPVSADEKLEEEQKGIIEFMKREAGRSEELTSIPLETEMTIFVDNPQIRCKTRFTNTAKDHRIRLLVKTHNTRPSKILKASMRW